MCELPGPAWRATEADTALARTDRLPQLSLSGLLGFTANGVSGLLDRSNAAASVAITLGWTALDFGRTRASIDAAQALGDIPRIEHERAASITRSVVAGRWPMREANPLSTHDAQVAAKCLKRRLNRAGYECVHQRSMRAATRCAIGATTNTVGSTTG